MKLTCEFGKKNLFLYHNTKFIGTLGFISNISLKGI